MASRLSTRALLCTMALSVLYPFGLLLYPNIADAQTATASCATSYIAGLLAPLATSLGLTTGGVTTSSAAGGTAAGLGTGGTVAATLLTVPVNPPITNLQLAAIGTALGATNVVNGAGNLNTSLAAAGATQQSFYTCILKPLAIMMAQRILANITNSLVTWIQSGFNGSPAFATNIDDLISTSANQAIGEFIQGTQLSFLCSPFSLQIRIALATGFSQQPYSKCTLSQIDQNIENFGHTQQAWNSWLNVSTVPANNQYGAYIQASGILADQLNAQAQKINNMINRNGGFLDYQTCDSYKTVDTFSSDPTVAAAQLASINPSSDTSSVTGLPGMDSSQNTTGVIGAINGGAVGAGTVSPSLPISTQQVCAHSHTTTPGTAIQSALAAKFGADFNQLGLATDIDQVIGALVNELVTKAITGAGGLLGASTQSVSNSADLSVVASQNTSNAGVINELNSESSSAIGVEGSALQENNQTNLATNAIPTASSVGIGSDPKNAIDGNVDTEFVSSNETSPSYTLDLGSSQSFDSIQIDAPYPIASTLGDIEVEISNSSVFSQSDSSTKIWDSKSNTFLQANASSGAEIFNATTSNSFEISSPGTAEYIKITKASNTLRDALGNCVSGQSDSSNNCTDPLQISEILVLQNMQNQNGANSTSTSQTNGSSNNIPSTSIISSNASGNSITVVSGTPTDYQLNVSANGSFTPPLSATMSFLPAGGSSPAINSFSGYSLIHTTSPGSSVADDTNGVNSALLNSETLVLKDFPSSTTVDLNLIPSNSAVPGSIYTFTMKITDATGTVLGTNTENFVVGSSVGSSQNAPAASGPSVGGGSAGSNGSSGSPYGGGGIDFVTQQ